MFLSMNKDLQEPRTILVTQIFTVLEFSKETTSPNAVCAICSESQSKVHVYGNVEASYCVNVKFGTVRQ